MRRHCAPIRLHYHLRTGVSTEYVVLCVPVTSDQKIIFSGSIRILAL
jgi:hypothetical protein